MNPHARSVNTFRQQFRWQRRSHCLWLIRAFAGSTIPLASDDATPGHRFDFDLFAVFMLPRSLERQTTASTDFGVVRNIDFLNACGKVRVISALLCRTSRLLPSLLLIPIAASDFARSPDHAYCASSRPHDAARHSLHATPRHHDATLPPEPVVSPTADQPDFIPDATYSLSAELEDPQILRQINSKMPIPSANVYHSGRVSHCVDFTFLTPRKHPRLPSTHRFPVA